MGIETRRIQRVLAALACAGALVAPTLLAGTEPSPFGRLIHQQESLYHRISVYESGSVRTLRFASRDPTMIQSQVDLKDMLRHMNEYTVLAYAGLLYKPAPKRVLVVGLGGGVIPRDMHHYLPEAEIDVAEIDPDIPPVAERFFGFKTDDKLKVHVADGRVFIRQQLRKTPALRYDIIILDAFLADYIPFHLMTKEFLQEVKAILADDGVVVANVLLTNRLAHSELKTFREVFNECQAFNAVYSSNVMIVGCGPRAAPLTRREAEQRAAQLQREYGFAFDIRWVATRLMPNPRPAGWAEVLTDDKAPVNYLRWQETEEPFQTPAAP